MPRKNVHPLEARLAQRLRQRRLLLGLSQSDLGKTLGVTYQAVQRYETLRNSLGAAQLYAVAQRLAVPVEYFFAEDPAEPALPSVDDRDALRLAQRIADMTPAARVATEKVLDVIFEAQTLSLTALEALSAMGA